MIYIVIHDQETVVDVLCFSYHNCRILGIMSGKVLLQGFSQAAGTDFRRYSALSFGLHQEHTFVYIIIYQNDAGFCRPYKVCGKNIGIEYLTVIEDTFYGRQGCADKEIDFSVTIIQTNFMFYQTGIYSVLKVHHSLIYRVSTQQVFFKYRRCPPSETYSIPTIYTIAYRQYHIKVIISDMIGLLSGITHMFQNGTCAILV